MFNKKSITPIMSIVLLILLTISVTGVAYVWVNNFSDDFVNNVNEGSQELDSNNYDMEILSVYGDHVVVRNNGKDNISEVYLVVNGDEVKYTLSVPLGSGETTNISYAAQSTDENLKVVIKTTNDVLLDSTTSKASENTEDKGFVDNSNPDSSSTNCLNNDSNNIWFSGSVSGENSACCGDDGGSDDFYNGSVSDTTDFCLNGYYSYEYEIDENQTICEEFNYNWINITWYPIVHYRFDESSGTTAIDEMGNYNGTLNNDPSRVSGKFGNALSFDGTNDYVSVADNSVLDFENSNYQLVFGLKLKDL